MGLAKEFARFVVNTRVEDVDDSILEHIKKLTLKQVMGMRVGYDLKPGKRAES